MNICERFISWVKQLFVNATAAVNLNGSLVNNFRGEREARQGCPLASYLFLIVEEALTNMIRKTVAKGRVKRILLPRGAKH